MESAQRYELLCRLYRGSLKGTGEGVPEPKRRMFQRLGRSYELDGLVWSVYQKAHWGHSWNG